MRILSFDIGINNLAFCLLSIGDVLDASFYDRIDVEEWAVLAVNGSKKERDGKKVEFNMTARNLLGLLKSRFPVGDIDIDVVLIENQPVMKNPVMKSIQMIIYTFFMMRDERTLVLLQSASNKLKVKRKADVDISHIVTENKYNKNKKVGVEYAKHYIGSVLCEGVRDRWSKHLELNKAKCDDLADSFLQAISYMESHC